MQTGNGGIDKLGSWQLNLLVSLSFPNQYHVSLIPVVLWLACICRRKVSLAVKDKDNTGSGVVQQLSQYLIPHQELLQGQAG